MLRGIAKQGGALLRRNFAGAEQFLLLCKMEKSPVACRWRYSLGWFAHRARATGREGPDDAVPRRGKLPTTPGTMDSPEGAPPRALVAHYTGNSRRTPLARSLDRRPSARTPTGGRLCRTFPVRSQRVTARVP